MSLIFLILVGVSMVIAFILLYQASGASWFEDTKAIGEKKETAGFIFLFIAIAFGIIWMTATLVFEYKVDDRSWPFVNTEKIDIEIIDINGKDTSYIVKDDNTFCEDSVDKIYTDENTYIIKTTYTDGFYEKPVVDLYTPTENIKENV